MDNPSCFLWVKCHTITVSLRLCQLTSPWCSSNSRIQVLYFILSCSQANKSLGCWTSYTQGGIGNLSCKTSNKEWSSQIHSSKGEQLIKHYCKLYLILQNSKLKSSVYSFNNKTGFSFESNTNEYFVCFWRFLGNLI